MYYERQEVLNLRVPERISVVGVGGVGTWVAIFCAMSGVPEIHLHDDDRIEVHNLNRLPFPPENITELKVEVVRDFIHSIRPDAVVFRHPLVTEDTIWLVSGVVFDCTDRFATQRLVARYCAENELEYVRAGYDGTHISVGAFGAWATENARDEGGYNIVPSWVVPASIVAALAVAKAMKYPGLDIACDIGEIGGRSLSDTIRPSPRTQPEVPTGPLPPGVWSTRDMPRR